MAANGYGHSRPGAAGGSIAMALIAYGQQGGALYAAYRLPDNPLSPTHVRWQGESGEVIEAQHGSENAYDLPQEEREAWAQIALNSASNQADSVGPNAPWLPVTLDRPRAFELGVRAQRARLASQPPQSARNSAPHMSGAPASYSNAPYGAPPSSQIPHGAPTPMHPYQLQSPPHSPNPRSDEYPPTRMIDALPSSAPSMPEPPQNTGQWSRDELLRGGAPTHDAGKPQQEITAVPCVEVEMPMLLTADQQDFTRDFARDVAIHFGRAARAIPQARELRVWMRGARIVLAVRMGFGPGSRPASRAEMEHAAALLADALARRTLPYAQLRFADAAEWNQGVELPE
jgi:hypothetical protein